MFTLKKTEPDFEMVDGPFAGRKFRAGESYAEVPPAEKRRFEAVAAEPISAPTGQDSAEGPAKEGGKKK